MTEGSDRLSDGIAVEAVAAAGKAAGTGADGSRAPAAARVMSGRAPRAGPEDPKKIATGMTLADISIRNHVFAWILMVALIGFGILCYTGFGDVFKGLGVSQNPDVDFPIVSVSVSLEGASPEIMETDVVDVLEDACATVEGVQQMSSTARQGSANLTLEFAIGREHRRGAPGRPDEGLAGHARPARARSTPRTSPRRTPRTSRSSGSSSPATGPRSSSPTT